MVLCSTNSLNSMPELPVRVSYTCKCEIGSSSEYVVVLYVDPTQERGLLIRAQNQFLYKHEGAWLGL